MNVELSKGASARVEKLVQDGAYPSVEAAVDALDRNERQFTHKEIEALAAPGYDDMAAGRVRPAEEVVAEARALVQGRTSRRPGA